MALALTPRMQNFFKMLDGPQIGTEPRRHWLHALYLQGGMRLRYYYESWLGLKPFILGMTAYPSKWRPKNCPEYDWFTVAGMSLIYLIAGVARDSRIGYAILCYTGLIHVMISFHKYLCNRILQQIEAAGFTEAQRSIPIPEYDWASGDPETFYKTFVKRPHPVILRGFMADQPLLKELGWDSVLGKPAPCALLRCPRGLCAVLLPPPPWGICCMFVYGYCPFSRWARQEHRRMILRSRAVCALV